MTQWGEQPPQQPELPRRQPPPQQQMPTPQSRHDCPVHSPRVAEEALEAPPEQNCRRTQRWTDQNPQISHISNSSSVWTSDKKEKGGILIKYYLAWDIGEAKRRRNQNFLPGLSSPWIQQWRFSWWKYTTSASSPSSSSYPPPPSSSIIMIIITPLLFLNLDSINNK